ncbi:ParA family protein [Massilia sp.]|uniref:ParA family protein n=1 Tax=Massilia sp. TaxID=1882437 RepID=UPI00352BDB44
MAMKTVVFANQKGGIGKTTTSRHQFWHFEEKGLRTLGIDLDIQGNFTRSLLNMAAENGIALPLDDFGRPALPETALRASGLFDVENKDQPLQVGKNTFLIGADAGMLDVERADLDEVVKAGQQRFKELADDYDVAVIDTGPSVSGLLVVALSIADFAVSPCKPDRDAIEGLMGFFTNVRRVAERGTNPRLASLGVLPNQIDRKRAFHRSTLDEMRQNWGDGVLPVELPERAAIDVAKDRPVWRTEAGTVSRSVAAKEMMAVCACISNRMGL